MTRIPVALGARSYDVLIADSYRRLAEALASVGRLRHGWVISHRRLLARYGPELLGALRRAGWTVQTLSVPESESSKSLAMVQRALGAATDLEKEGVSVEVVDPRTLVPLDESTILESVRKTHRLVIAHEAVKRGGFGAELAALVTEKALDELDAPIVRVAARNVPMPYNDTLEKAVIPSREEIAAAIRSLL